MRVRTPLLMALVPLAVASCSRDPNDAIEQADKEVQSWAATLDLAADDHANHRLPDRAYREILSAARDELAQQRKSLGGVPEGYPGHPPLEARLRGLQRRLDDLSQEGGAS